MTLDEILAASRAATGFKLPVTSGYRSPEYNRKVGGAKASYHTRDLARDISMAGLDDAQRAALVNDLMGRLGNAGGFITYDNHPDMLHVDMRPTRHFMHNKSARNMGMAPDWFRKTAGVAASPKGTTLSAQGPGLAALAPNGLLARAPDVSPASFPAKPAAPVSIPDGPKGQEMIPPPVTAPVEMAGNGLEMAGMGAPSAPGILAGMDMAGMNKALGQIAGSMGRDPQAEAHNAPIQSSLGAVEAADAGRMAAGQQLMAQLLNSKRKRIPGVSLGGVMG